VNLINIEEVRTKRFNSILDEMKKIFSFGAKVHPGCAYCSCKDIHVNKVFDYEHEYLTISVLCESCNREDWIVADKVKLAKIALYL
jgi:hypothetical protein